VNGQLVGNCLHRSDKDVLKLKHPCCSAAKSW